MPDTHHGVRMPSISAAMFSTWPIFGVLALVQQTLPQIQYQSSAEGLGVWLCAGQKFFRNRCGTTYS